MHTVDLGNVLIRASNISKSFERGQVRALDNVSLEIFEGEVLAITGPSGSGKTTLLQILGTLRKPDKGEVLFEEKDYRSIRSHASFRSRQFGFIFQFPQLIPVLTAEENVMLPLIGSDLALGKMRSRARELLDMADASHLSKRRVSHLSAGEKQRVSLCRAFANQPRLILADEPTGFLDRENRHKIMDLMKDFNKEFGTTQVLTTHDQELKDWAMRNLKLSDGKIV
jgi:ABC-type lipoprotein export system ATPase subunit